MHPEESRKVYEVLNILKNIYYNNCDFIYKSQRKTVTYNFVLYLKLQLNENEKISSSCTFKNNDQIYTKSINIFNVAINIYLKDVQHYTNSGNFNLVQETLFDPNKKTFKTLFSRSKEKTLLIHEEINRDIYIKFSNINWERVSYKILKKRKVLHKKNNFMIE